MNWIMLNMIPPEILYSALGFLLGIVICFVFFQRKRRLLETDLASERERIGRLESENQRISLLETERQRLSDKIQVLGEDRSRLSAMADRIPILEKTLDGAQRRNEELRGAKESLEAELKAGTLEFREIKRGSRRIIQPIRIH